jgi:hypothetical protein
MRGDTFTFTDTDSHVDSTSTTTMSETETSLRRPSFVVRPVKILQKEVELQQRVATTAVRREGPTTTSPSPSLIYKLLLLLFSFVLYTSSCVWFPRFPVKNLPQADKHTHTFKYQFPPPILSLSHRTGRQTERQKEEAK